MFLKAANNVETHIWVGIDIYLILALSKDKSCFFNTHQTTQHWLLV